MGFTKILKHNITSASASLRHCDKDIRAVARHGNRHIDAEKTKENKQICGDYRDTVKKAKSRILDLDTTTNTNRRKDRVEVLELTIPIPAAIGDVERYLEDVSAIIAERFGEKNLLNCYLHRDEVHEYVDHGTTRTSLCHIHAFAIPEKDGKLNCREVTSRQNIVELNHEIDVLSREKYHTPYISGNGNINDKTVEELKAQSEREAVDILNAVHNFDPGIEYEESDDGEYAMVHKTDLETMIKAAAVGKTYAEKYYNATIGTVIGEEKEALESAISEEQNLVALLQKRLDDEKKESKKIEAAKKEAERSLAEIKDVIKKSREDLREKIRDICDEQDRPELRYQLSKIEERVNDAFGDAEKEIMEKCEIYHEI